MRISIISWLHNDAAIAPFFFSHYSFADEIIILLDDRTTDLSAAIANSYPNVTLIPYFSNKANNQLGADSVNKVAAGLSSDWIVCACNDEFVFPKDGAPWRDTLEKANGNLIYASMWQVYRHREDKDLDPTLPTVPQRRHGDTNRTEGVNGMYRKPMIFKSGYDIKMGIGGHVYIPNDRVVVSTTEFDGAHWLMADTSLAIPRRMRGVRALQNEEDLRLGRGRQHFDITEEKIIAECNKHLDDPLLF